MKPCQVYKNKYTVTPHSTSSHHFQHRQKQPYIPTQVSHTEQRFIQCSEGKKMGLESKFKWCYGRKCWREQDRLFQSNGAWWQNVMDYGKHSYCLIVPNEPCGGVGGGGWGVGGWCITFLGEGKTALKRTTNARRRSKDNDSIIYSD